MAMITNFAQQAADQQQMIYDRCNVPVLSQREQDARAARTGNAAPQDVFTPSSPADSQQMQILDMMRARSIQTQTQGALQTYGCHPGQQ